MASPIACVMIKDQAKDGSGGYATIKEGGFNYRHVTINFKSQRGKDIQFAVDIYGSPYAQPIYPNAQPQAHPAGWVYPQQFVYNRN